MAQALHIITRTVQGVNDDRNLVREVIMNLDNADSDAVNLVAAVTAMNLLAPVESGAEAVYPAGYFDTITEFGLTPSGILGTDLDILAYAPRVAAELS